MSSNRAQPRTSRRPSPPSTRRDGTPLFPDSGVPVRSLVDHLRDGGSIDSFHRSHPEVEATSLREVLLAALEQFARPRGVTRQGSLLPQIDSSGTVINPEELTADQVVGRRVTCPACSGIVFRTWPEGWDSHAAYRCRGLTASDVSERKREFKSRYAHLFR